MSGVTVGASNSSCPGHHWSAGTWTRTDSMWSPHPAHVVLPQAQGTGLHMPSSLPAVPNPADDPPDQPEPAGDREPRNQDTGSGDH